MIDKGGSKIDLLNKMVLRAMKLGSAEAIQLFPVLLQQQHLGTVYKNVFKQEVRTF